MNGVPCYTFEGRCGVQKVDTANTNSVENPPPPDCFLGFEEGVGSTANDNSVGTTTHNGTLAAGTSWYTPAAAGSWAIATGSGEYCSILDHSDFDWDYNDPWTVSIYTSTLSASYSGIYVKRLGASPATTAYRGIAIFANNGNIEIYLVSVWGVVGSTDRAIFVSGTGTSTNIKTGNWHHVLVTYDGSTNASGITCWIDGTKHTVANGKLQISGGHDTLGADTCTNNVNVRLSNDTVTTTFPAGGVDHFNAWKGLYITDAQAAMLYNSGTPIDCRRGL